MKKFSSASFLVVALTAIAAAAEQNWVGEYANKSFLAGKAAFQMSIEQSGTKIQVSFDAVYNDGHGAAPEATGSAKMTSKGGLEFKWEDNFKNAGSGTITRAGDDLIVSIKPTRVSDSRCLDFYKPNIRLKRVKK